MIAKKIVKVSDITKEEWLEWKRKGISGTDVSAICGINPYKTAMQVYMDKMNPVEEQPDNDAMKFGRILEPVVAKEFQDRNPDYKVQRVNFMLQHPEHEWTIANIDRLVIDKDKRKGVLEIKTCSSYKAEQWENGKPNDEYMLQLQWYLFVTGLDYGWFACLAGGQKYFQVYIERDEELINYLFEIAQNFWNNHVVLQIPPPVDGSDASTEMLKKKYNKAEEGTAIQLESNYNQMIFERELLSESIKELETKKAEIENKIKEEMKENETAETESYVVSWKNVKGRETFDTKKFKLEHSDIAEKYIKHGEPSRKFEIKRRK